MNNDNGHHVLAIWMWMDPQRILQVSISRSKGLSWWLDKADWSDVGEMYASPILLQMDSRNETFLFTRRFDAEREVLSLKAPDMRYDLNGDLAAQALHSLALDGQESFRFLNSLAGTKRLTLTEKRTGKVLSSFDVDGAADATAYFHRCMSESRT